MWVMLQSCPSYSLMLIFGVRCIGEVDSDCSEESIRLM
jgi:hypothetical protein